MSQSSQPFQTETELEYKKDADNLSGPEVHAGAGVDYAKNNLSKCHRCKQRILEGELRSFQNNRSNDGTRFHHLKCWIPHQIICELFTIPGFHQLQHTDQESVYERLKSTQRWRPRDWTPSTTEERDSMWRSELECKKVSELRTLCCSPGSRNKQSLIEKIISQQQRQFPFISPIEEVETQMMEITTSPVDWQYEFSRTIFDVLPEEILFQVLLHIDLPSLYQISQTCSTFRRLVFDDDTFWKAKYQVVWPREWTHLTETLRKRKSLLDRHARRNSLCDEPGRKRKRSSSIRLVWRWRQFAEGLPVDEGKRQLCSRLRALRQRIFMQSFPGSITPQPPPPVPPGGRRRSYEWMAPEQIVLPDTVLEWFTNQLPVSLGDLQTTGLGGLQVIRTNGESFIREISEFIGDNIQMFYAEELVDSADEYEERTKPERIHLEPDIAQFWKSEQERTWKGWFKRRHESGKLRKRFWWSEKTKERLRKLVVGMKEESEKPAREVWKKFEIAELREICHVYKIECGTERLDKWKLAELVQKEFGASKLDGFRSLLSSV